MSATRVADEERRAREYRERHARIAANRRAMARRISARAAAFKRELDEDWRPYVLARRDEQLVADEEPDTDSEGWR